MITIFYSSDDRMFKQQFISVYSLAKTNKEPLRVISLTTEVPEYRKSSKRLSDAQNALLEKTLKEANPENTWTAIDVSDLFRKYFMHGPNAENKYYNMFVCVRLLAPFIKELGDKALWLDTDTIICKDLSELWNMDVTNYEVLGRRDLGRITKYFQTGVMLLNLKAIIESGSFEKAAEMVGEKKFICYIDMGALNKIIPNKKKKLIPTKFNSYNGKGDDCIIHHVCSVREGHIPFTKKWWHRIKPDEMDLLATKCPQYTQLFSEIKQIIKDNPECFHVEDVQQVKHNV